MTKRLLLFCFVYWITQASMAQLKISADRHYLTKDGKPFFWLGDTAWELFHRLTREEAEEYFKNRAAKGFTVIQAVALAELDGLNTPNAYGQTPLVNNDPTRPNEAYFKHVDEVIKLAHKHGLWIALLPTWADKWFKDQWGTGPEIFTPENARVFGEWIAKRYLHQPNIIWVMGGDRIPRNDVHLAIIRGMSEGVDLVDQNRHLLTYHPSGGSSSYDFFADDPWIDFHMSQTGHRVAAPDYQTNVKAYALKNPKPHVNGEPNYEDHPNDWQPGVKGWMDDFDTREAAYWNMLSGGAGHTYGNHNIWQMYTEKRVPINGARTHWKIAMEHMGAYQMGYMRRMFEKRNWQKLVMNQAVIVGENPEGVEYKMAAVSSDHDFLMVYLPFGRPTTVDLSAVKASQLRGWWFNPRDGYTIPLGEMANTGKKEFTPTSVGRGSDWLLIIDDASRQYPDPHAH